MPKEATLRFRDMLALKRAEQRAGAWLPDDSPRPKVRGECASLPRPCPFVGCRYHLQLTVTRTGSIQAHQGVDAAHLRKAPYTCALDAADEGPMELREMARALDLTVEGVLLIINSGLARLAQTEVVRENSEGKVLPRRRKVQNGRGRWREAKRAAKAIGAETTKPTL